MGAYEETLVPPSPNEPTHFYTMPPSVPGEAGGLSVASWVLSGVSLLELLVPTGIVVGGGGTVGYSFESGCCWILSILIDSSF